MGEDMSENICRAFTFINYHIPMRRDKKSEKKPEYITIGFFDGMFTERISFDYSRDSLKPLWEYAVSKTAENDGSYSHQNIFGFVMDDENASDQQKLTDEVFWSEEKNRQYPLTIVVCLQTQSYAVGNDSVSQHCFDFNKVIEDSAYDMISYTYSTVDKNDFIVCIKCGNYDEAVDAIKKLHQTSHKIVYSYSVLSVYSKVLEELSETSYPLIYQQKVPSICLKGVTNSYGDTKLDVKYRTFCDKLAERIRYIEHEEESEDEEYDYKVYDILGADDFRLIARDVNLGKLLKEYASGGMLNYDGEEFQFTLFSSSLVLNTIASKNEEVYRFNPDENLGEKFGTPLCDGLATEMENILKIVKRQEDRYLDDEKVITFCQAMWQLLQSLRALEVAPVKKYDFYSLYYPFAALVRIINNKLIGNRELGEEDEIYEFLHKISMTLHGTLRTDIQFFQVKDFNVVVHYSPAKLKAFYACWTLTLSDYYNQFYGNWKENKYSFVFSPGMYKGTGVKELFLDYSEKERLMLVTMPERHIYNLRCLLIILAHEVPHFVGHTVRNREKRHYVWLNIIARIAELEMANFAYKEFHTDVSDIIEHIIRDEPYLGEILRKHLVEEEKDVQERASFGEYSWHSENSKEIIEQTFRQVNSKWMEKITIDFCSLIKRELLEKLKEKESSDKKRLQDILKVTDACNSLSKQLRNFYELFQSDILSEIFYAVRYITGETFADVMAILTLNLTPEQYIFSFLDSELPQQTIKEANQDRAPLVAVRICLVEHTVSTIIKKNRTWYEKQAPSFSKEWSGDTLKRLARNFSKNSWEQMLAIKAYGYQDYIKNRKDEIGKYEALYNDTIGVQRFENKTLGFLCDKKIWEYFCEYFDKSAEMYFEQLRTEKNILNRKKEIENTFQKISGKSLINSIQVIDNFLMDFEHNNNNNS